MRQFAALAAALAVGCSVDIGAGSIAPVVIDAPIDAGAASPPVSQQMDIEFLSSDQSASLAGQYGGKLGAVDHVDVDVQELAVEHGDGTPVAGGSVALTVEGVTVDRAGQRVRLPDATKQKVLAAVNARAPLSLPLVVTVGWPTPPPPPALAAHAKLQPIVVVDAFDAL